MPKVNSTAATLVMAVFAAVAVATVIANWSTWWSGKPRAPSQAQATVSEAPRAVSATWAASAPGRVEPRSGEVRIGSQVSGKVAQVVVRMNDTVRAGDLLVRLADDDALARVVAATAEASVRRRERDGETVAKLATDRRAAEDAVAFAERTVHRARMDLDRIQASIGTAGGTAEELASARSGLTEANARLEQERAQLRRVLATAGMPLPTRLESALAASRAELTLAELALDRTRIRAPFDGTVLQIAVREGENASPAAEEALITFGDVSALRVRAELEERDVSKIRPGQLVTVRTDAYPGQDFAGRVERMAQALGPPRLASRGPRRASDVDVLQVMIDLDGHTPLLPGMRVDVFFRPDATAGGQTTARPN